LFDSTDYLKTLATKWSTKHTDDADRIERGLAVALAGKVAPHQLDSFRVAGTKPGVEYVVRVNNGWPSCTCPDFSGKGFRCKHIWASSLMTRLTVKIIEQMTDTPKPRPAQRPRRNDFPAANDDQAEASKPLAVVLPFRK
jgi:uncharacterized Zn finger protein